MAASHMYIGGVAGVLVSIGLVIASGCSAGSISGDDDGDDDASGPDDPDARDRIDSRIPGDPIDAATPADAWDGTCQPPVLGVRTAPGFGPPSVTTSGLLVRVMNNCPFPLWIHSQGHDGAGGTNVLLPDDVRLAQGEVKDYDGRQTMISARITAFVDGPRQHELQFVELNFANGELGYNVSYVDYLALPVEVTAACGTTACYAPAAGILDGCPAQLKLADRCLSARSWCFDPGNQGDPYCHLLDATAQAALEIDRCATDLANWRNSGHGGDPVGGTPAVYACTDFWASSAFCCAVVNRGVVDSDEPEEACNFYRDAPHNSYARWVHETCPLIYAFPYDDAANQSGYHQCQTRELQVTWCPGG